MPFLTHVILSPRSNQVQSELRDPYQMHRTFAKAFGDNEEAQLAARCLFRVERDDAQGVHVLVQTRVRPDWSRVTKGEGYFALSPRVKQISPIFAAGSRYIFRLRANPTVVKDGKRFGLYGEDEMQIWLRRKSEDAGFELETFSLVKERQVRAIKAGQRISLSAARFDGVLAVTDVELFTKAWECGIGAAKGFGFGLLSLAPIGRR